MTEISELLCDSCELNVVCAKDVSSAARVLIEFTGEWYMGEVVGGTAHL